MGDEVFLWKIVKSFFKNDLRTHVTEYIKKNEEATTAAVVKRICQGYVKHGKNGQQTARKTLLCTKHCKKAVFGQEWAPQEIRQSVRRGNRQINQKQRFCQENQKNCKKWEIEIVTHNK